MSIFSDRLKKEREIKKKENSAWTQAYVANLIGVARTTYTAYENGTKEPPREKINKLADLYNVSIDYLEGRTNERRPISQLLNQVGDEKLDFPFYDSNGVQFIARSNKNLSPAAYKKMQELAKKAAELFAEDED